MRIININRETKETEIKLELNMDGKGICNIDTSISFLDHIITSMVKHAKLDLTLYAKSKDGIKHHLIEDVAMVLGLAIDQALGDRKGIARFGYSLLPMDGSLAKAAVDLVRRSYYILTINIERGEIEGIAREDILHFFESLLKNLNACVHLIIEYGENDHHKIEALIKAFALALRQAIKIENDDIPSTKGVI